MEVNLYAAWIAMLMGIIAGAVQGLFFHREQWLGGYQSWERRMTRLGHISFFGIAFINLGFAFTVSIFGINPGQLIWASRLLIVGQIGMPFICYLSAVFKPARNLFFIPVLAVAAAILQLLLVFFHG